MPWSKTVGNACRIVRSRRPRTSRLREELFAVVRPDHTAPAATAADDPVDPPARRIHLHFLRTPLRVEGLEDRVSAVVVGRNAVVDGRVVATGEEERIEAGLLVRAIGYAGEPVPGLPHDEDAGIVPNAAGRVLDGDLPVPGAYVTG